MRNLNALRDGLNACPNTEIREWWSETYVFPFIRSHHDFPFSVGRLCDYFGVTIDDFQHWRWVVNCHNKEA